MMPRDAGLSDSYTSDHCCFSSSATQPFRSHIHSLHQSSISDPMVNLKRSIEHQKQSHMKYFEVVLSLVIWMNIIIDHHYVILKVTIKLLQFYRLKHYTFIPCMKSWFGWSHQDSEEESWFYCLEKESYTRPVITCLRAYNVASLTL